LPCSATATSRDEYPARCVDTVRRQLCNATRTISRQSRSAACISVSVGFEPTTLTGTDGVVAAQCCCDSSGDGARPAGRVLCRLRPLGHETRLPLSQAYCNHTLRRHEIWLLIRGPVSGGPLRPAPTRLGSVPGKLPTRSRAWRPRCQRRQTAAPAAPPSVARVHRLQGPREHSVSGAGSRTSPRNILQANVACVSRHGRAAVTVRGQCMFTSPPHPIGG
jgi:hypothetical protein